MVGCRLLIDDSCDAVRMNIKRVVPDLESASIRDTQRFYSDVFGLQPVMDHGWIVTLADSQNPSCQINLMSHDETAPVIPDVSIETSDVEGTYRAAVQAGAEIVHPLTDEPWGVRRFFLRDPDGHVINVLHHPGRSEPPAR
jgi:catechol 2,3-dioxygenase-like lactoylglutathione lyase family enzyme